MNGTRVGLSIRALRRRRRWRQDDLAAAAGVSAHRIRRAERGDIQELPVAVVEAIAGALGATLDLRLQWHGEGLDRLLDASHAAVVEAIVRRLQADCWETRTEVTFNIDGERGSVDVLARRVTGPLLVVECKSVVPDLQGMLVSLDRKARLGARIAREVGWTDVRSVSRLLVIAESRSSRRRIAEHAVTLTAAFPLRGQALRQWLRSPGMPCRGLLFIDAGRSVDLQQRVRIRQPTVPKRC